MEPPELPDESDCCNSGCTPCILDVYETQLKKYQNCLKTGQNPITTINCISPSSYTTFTLTSRRQISPTVFLLKFEYAETKDKSPNCFKYNPGQYLLLRWKDHEGEFTRAYTPLPIQNEAPLGFTIIVRTYSIGRMSRLLKKLEVGHKTSWRGPYGDIVVSFEYKYFLFIAQGTGIAPIFAVINDIVKNDECESFVKLFFCCRDSDDILLRDELYELGAFWNFSCEIFLSNSEGLVRKYNETVHESKLCCENVENYISEKMGLQVIICGSENFSEYYKNQLQKLDYKRQ